MAQVLSPRLNEVLKKSFDDLIKDKRGKVTKAQLRRILQTIGQNPTRTEMDEIMLDDHIDVDREGFCKFIETNITLKSQAAIDEEMAEAFSKFETTQKFLISKAEFKDILTKMGDDPLTVKEADDLLTSLGVSGHDQLNVTELSKLMGSH